MAFSSNFNITGQIYLKHFPLVGVGAEYAGPALERLGAKGPFDPGYRSSWAFAGYTGPDPKPWVREESRPAEQGPTLVSNLIYTPAYEQGRFKLRFHTAICLADFEK